MSRRVRVFELGMMTGLLAPLTAGAAEPPSAEEMWRVIQAQQKTIDELKAKLEQSEGQLRSTSKRVEAAEQKVEATAEAVETATEKPKIAATWVERTRIGGYGELHYNNLDNDDTGAETDQVDFHRFVLYLGHEFNDRIRFYSELEFEHAFLEATEVEAEDENGDGVLQPGEIEVERTPGEVELEQAWVELDLTREHRLRAGIDLIPVGILNLTHEPPTFYGVERNPVETFIIPTTWREAAIGLHGELGRFAPGWSYDLVGHSGLDTPTEGNDAFQIRSGRRNVAEAPADDGALTGRIRYTGIAGLEAAVSAQYQSDVTQGVLDIDGTLVEGHIDLRRGGFGLRALAARWDLDGGPEGLGPESVDSPARGRESQWGWYIEPSYRFSIARFTPLPGELGFFVRYNQFDTNAGSSVINTEQKQMNGGFNYWPHSDVVFKFDVQEQFGQRPGNDDDGFNLGVGYQFY
ncbi:MAG: porin [Gammaproteobacteria bacterium]